MSISIPLEVRPEGLWCTEGKFYIDAWKPVPLCIVTHAHGDHAYWGHKHYIASNDSKELIQHRLGGNVSLQSLAYGQKIKLGNCWVSLHPAGHILGSAQIRIETKNSVIVISGDYKRAFDNTCAPFEVVECETFVTESTFGLPLYHWQENHVIAQQIFDWWQINKANQHPSVLFCYALGKAQRILGLLAKFTEQPVFLHGAIQPLAEIYRQKGIAMIPFEPVSQKEKGSNFSQDLILAPPSAAGSLWFKRFPHFRTASASGWMQVRGTRKRKNMDQGFVLSDHADWPALINTVKETGASQILTTHGSTFVLAKYLQEELHLEASELKGLKIIDVEDD